MSESSQPITPARFAAALKDLTLASIYAKVSEIRNSIAHLKRSNEDMQVFVDEGDRDFVEHIWENLAVIKRSEERLDLLKAEVENRGYIWHDENSGEVLPGQLSPPDQEMHEAGQSISTATTSVGAVADHTQTQGGSLDDSELARRLAERMQETMDDDDDGVHL